MSAKDYTEINDVLKKLKYRLQVAKKQKEIEVLKEWTDIVGEKLSSYTYPMYIVKGNLYIGSEGSSWFQEASFLRQEIIKRVNEKFGKEVVKDIKFKIGKKP